MTYQRQLTTSPRSVWIRQRDSSSCHSARVTPVWKGRRRSVRSARRALEVEPDLFAEGVALARHVAEFFEHGQIDVGLDVAHDARVAVPVPGAADPRPGR